MISLSIAAALGAAVISTAFISGIFGMAGGMILLGILLVLLPVATAMVLHGVTQLASNGWRAWLWRAHIQWRIVGHYAAGAAVVAAFAVAVGSFAPSQPVVLIGLALVTFAGLALPARFAPDIMQWSHAFGCGALCTVLQFMAGVAGPVFDVFFLRSKLDRHQMVATKAAVQGLSHLLKIVYFGQFLIAGGEALAPMAVILAVALAVIGTQLSRYILNIISDAQFRAWTRALIAAVAVIYLGQGLYLLVDVRSAVDALASPFIA